ncbi:MAG TPA: phosphoglycerate mutase family protein [Vicinamibacterales bacterium]|nr:phosphoglycerate mutase family protein [Vicinamibacterales bacterium]
MSRRIRRFGFTLLSALVLPVMLSADASAQQVVYLVRHAERADQQAPGGQMMAATDPPLSPAGEARATRLAAMLKDAGISTIFTTDYRRTRDTGAPLAASLGKSVVVHPARDTPGLVARLRAEHSRDVVLVVGHSNSVPDIIKALGGPTITIAESEYDNLFVFVPATGALSRIRF